MKKKKEAKKMKGTELTKIEKKVIQMPMTEGDVRQRFDLIQKVMKSRMKEDVHFGKIPGCGDKMTLLKPGSEMLLSMFRIAVDPQVEDLSSEDEAKFRITARGIFAPTEEYLGAGVGCASSNEDKYKWREVRSQSEWDNTPETRRRYKFKRNPGKEDIKIMQVRVEPADVANTILKMAKKRAQIDMTLTVLAVSDIFTQDLEDEVEAPAKGKPVVAEPKAKVEAKEEKPEEKQEIKPEVKTPPTAKGLLDAARAFNFPIARIKSMSIKLYKKEKSTDLTPKEISELIDWIKKESK